MSNSSAISAAVLLGTTADAVPSLRHTLSPGIVGLFVQGLETGLVLAQLSSWLSAPEHAESLFIISLTVFVTIVGFAQTGICFASAWRIYVAGSGQPVFPRWTERIQCLLTTTIASPVQSLLIWRCYYILKGKLYIIILLVSLLLGSIVLSILVTVGLFLSESDCFWFPLLLYSIFPPALDIAISAILLCYLIQTRRRVYAKQKHQRIASLITIVWQSAVPPTICAVILVITYVVSEHFEPAQLVMWYPTLQEMIAKLYILSLFYNLNTRTLFDGESTSATYVNSLTLPTINGASLASI